MRQLFLLFLLFTASIAQAQTAIVMGTVRHENGKPIELATVSLSSEPTGTNTDSQGHYRIEVPAGKRITLNFSFVSAEPQKVYLKLKPSEEHKLDVVLKGRSNNMQEFVKKGQKTPNEAGSVYILDPKHLNEIAGPGEGLTSAIKSLVGSRNELTSQYTVRGGNYD
ncbi:MAG: carboxypeptidase-like regulatory domain-containing protein, partial [Chitinophagaceae bacterium]